MNSNAYLIRDKEENDLKDNYFFLIYQECSQQQLAKALPVSYENNNKNYLLALFDNDGRDYLKQGDLNDINELLDDNKVIYQKFLTEYVPGEDFLVIKKKFKHLTINLYNEYIKFYKKQII